MPAEAGKPGLTRHLAIVNERGLHARASAKFVETVERFDAVAEVSRDGQTVLGDSIMGLLLLAAAPGSEIEVTTTGPEAEALMEALTTLVASRFGEDS
ncbi:MAG: HPr family phosphocarrier protein [Pseudomonadota bacterium]